MLINTKRLASAAAALLVGAGVAAAASGSGQTSGSGRAGPVRCEIVSEQSGGMIALQAVVHADRRIDGAYSFRVRGAGRSGGTDITQGGAFSAGPRDEAQLGEVMLGARGTYEASLVVTSGTKTWRCDERVGAI